MSSHPDAPPATDTLRLAVAERDGGGFELQVFINGAEITSAGAGLGMDPSDMLIPNRLIAGGEPGTFPLARCTCGEYGCGATYVTVSRDGDRVRWEWSHEEPMDRAVIFAAEAYDAEVARIGEDRSWATPLEIAGLLVRSGVDRARLAAHGLTFHVARASYLDAGQFTVTLVTGDHQVFVTTPWLGRSPEELAREVCATLAKPPREWDATWFAPASLTTPPPMAGPAWRRLP